MDSLTGDWTLVQGQRERSQTQSARARMDGEDLVIQVYGGPEIRLSPDLTGMWRWGSKSSERQVKFRRCPDGSLKGEVVGARGESMMLVR